MAESEYQDYLAARVLSESKPVTYRLLSRALQVNVNVAKRMLFDFHYKQNAKKPKSVHATYVVSGTKRIIKPSAGKDGDDTVMQSSPPMSSIPERAVEEGPVKRTAIIITREEELEATRAQFEKELSIHIYSLEPGPIEDLSVLSACNQEVHSQHGDDDPLERWRTYGSIHNPHIKRRTTKYTPPTAATKSTPAVSKPAAKPVTKPAPIAHSKKEISLPSRQGSVSGTSTPQPTAQSAATTSTLKRSDSKSGAKKDKTVGDIFKSFAKAKAKLKDDKSKESTPAPAEDEPMQGMSEDEGDSDDAPEVAFDDEAAEAAKKARQERADKLRKMMEEDPDEEMADAPAAEEAQADVSQPEEVEPEERPTVTVSNGRRRGRRRVMIKKKVKDEEGYLVTKEEAAWESFSEDEPEPKKLKPAPTKPAPKGKTTKGQGSIASFFKKA